MLPLLIDDLADPLLVDALLAAAEAAGYHPPPARPWRDLPAYDRDNLRALLIDPGSADALYALLLPALPHLPGWRPSRLNPHLRLYRYGPGGYMAPHTDGAFRADDQEQSHLTLLLYLQDACTGGETVLHLPDGPQTVAPRARRALLFPHTARHEGRPVQRGEKIVLRTDVLFRRAQG